MIKLRSRKGLSGVISAMFIIMIFFMCLLSVFAITSLTNSYNQTVLDRQRMDWERATEHLTFSEAVIGINHVLNVTFSNDGRVTLHIIQVWLSEFSNNSYLSSNWQLQFWTSRYVSSGETVSGFGFFPDFRRVGVGSIGTLTALSGLTGSYYKIRVVTERGNTFECQVPWPPPSLGGSGFYALIISDDHDNFQYTQALMTEFKSAYLKPAGKDRVLYRILLRNTTNRTIDFLSNSTMIQSIYAGGHMIMRYIVSSQSKSWPDHLVAFSSQSINPGEEQYVYFAATVEGGNSWVTTDEKQGSNPYYMVGFSIAFKYRDDPELRSLPLPVVTQCCY